MKVRLYIDEDAMSRALLQGLTARGIDVTSVYEEKMVGQSDISQIDYATKLGRALYTFNIGDFCNIHNELTKQGKNHAGIIVVYRQHYSVGEQIKRLAKLINTKSQDDMKNYLYFL